MVTARTCTAALASALGAFAIGVPGAGAATPAPFAGFKLPALTAPSAAALPAFGALPAAGALPAVGALPALTPAVPLSFVAPSLGFVGSAIGPTVIGSVFNGATVVQVVNGPAGSSVLGSP
jgi:hypothetical protein